ncbi:hypothetical protein GCM10028787_09530 [Brachybacterium horti]
MRAGGPAHQAWASGAGEDLVERGEVLLRQADVDGADRRVQGEVGLLIDTGDGDAEEKYHRIGAVAGVAESEIG